MKASVCVVCLALVAFLASSCEKPTKPNEPETITISVAIYVTESGSALPIVSADVVLTTAFYPDDFRQYERTTDQNGLTDTLTMTGLTTTGKGSFSVSVKKAGFVDFDTTLVFEGNAEFLPFEVQLQKQ